VNAQRHFRHLPELQQALDAPDMTGQEPVIPSGIGRFLALLPVTHHGRTPPESQSVKKMDTKV